MWKKNMGRERRLIPNLSRDLKDTNYVKVNAVKMLDHHIKDSIIALFVKAYLLNSSQKDFGMWYVCTLNVLNM